MKRAIVGPDGAQRKYVEDIYAHLGYDGGPDSEFVEAFGRLEGFADAIVVHSNSYAKAQLMKLLPVPLAPPAIHPEAHVSWEATIGPGTIINAGAVIQPGAVIGDGCMIHANAVVEHDCVLADYVNVAPGAVLCGHVRVGKFVLIGAGATVIPAIEIGCDAVVGAGAVVIEAVPDGLTVVGVPARDAHPTMEISTSPMPSVWENGAPMDGA